MYGKTHNCLPRHHTYHHKFHTLSAYTSSLTNLYNIHYGNKEFGKDFILVTNNLFGIKEYYGVQAKAGSLSGTATSNIMEITNQINMGFNVPYKMVSGEDVYITKMIVFLSQ